MKIKKAAAVYAILVGLPLLISCIAIMATGLASELSISLSTIPLTSLLAFCTQLLAAIALLVSGVAAIRRAAWADKAFLAGIGALCCSIILIFSSATTTANVFGLLTCVVVLVTGLIITLPILTEFTKR